jgi:hypothetical protein
MPNIYDILKRASPTRLPDEYVAKMLHAVPETKSIDRVAFLKAQCTDKVVLHVGCGGPLHGMLKPLTKKLYGVDVVPMPEVENLTILDLDSPALQHYSVPEDVEVILLAEVLEHLTNPGLLLKHLRPHPALKIITVPNAFSASGFKSLQRGTETVNREHVAYYSWHTLTVLVERYGYTVDEWWWYNGPAKFAEGIIFVVR